jgi:hypothetical protein
VIVPAVRSEAARAMATQVEATNEQIIQMLDSGQIKPSPDDRQTTVVGNMGIGLLGGAP